MGALHCKLKSVFFSGQGKVEFITSPSSLAFLPFGSQVVPSRSATFLSLKIATGEVKKF